MTNIKQFNKIRAMVKGRTSAPITIQTLQRNNAVGTRVIKNGTGRQVNKGFKVR